MDILVFTPQRLRKPAHGPTNHRDAALYCRLIQLARPKGRLIHVAQIRRRITACIPVYSAAFAMRSAAALASTRPTM
jgi:hypothetical protein